MLVQEYTNESNQFSLGEAKTDPRDLFATRESRQRFEFERKRAERSNTAFCVIAMTFPKRSILKRHESTLTDVIDNRIRFMDERVSLTDTQIGVVTPYTNSEAAKVLATDLKSLLPPTLPKPLIEIHEYRPHIDGGRRGNSSSTTNRQQIDLSISGISQIAVQPTPFWKRGMDIVGAVGGLILLSPVLILVALLIKLSSKGPVLYSQQRTGRGGKPFWIYKFRSMIVDAEQHRDTLAQLNEQDGPAFKMQNDPRITSIGHWLRSLSVDELPQLWNVLKGQMSFVGPRPLPCEEANQCEIWQRRRLAISPGITGSWQVLDRSTPIPFAEWMRMDIRYTDSVSLKRDLQLLFQTLGFLCWRRNH